MKLLEKIKKKKVNVSVLGLGYVGLPLAVEFAKAGFHVFGIDIDESRIAKLNKGISYVEDVAGKELNSLVNSGRITGFSTYEKLSSSDVIIICVPTPMRKSKEPNISFVLEAAKQIANHMSRRQLIILESTTYPGTTEELILSLFVKRGKRVGKDFCLAYSPERVDPGNKRYTTIDIPKVVGGVTPKCLKVIKILYGQVFKKVVPVSSTKVAETIKLLENTFRTVNIALVDEIALMCRRMGIDVWEVIRGASTKPFGFMPFYPGPGVGGACLPKDPLYLAWRARHFNFNSRFIALASDITTSMPKYVVGEISGFLKKNYKKNLKDSNILILGVGYKKDIGDTRDSPAFEVMRILQARKAAVSYNDPYVPNVAIGKKKYNSVDLSRENLEQADIVVVTTAHSKYDWSYILRYSRLVYDTRGVTWGVTSKKNNVIRL